MCWLWTAGVILGNYMPIIIHMVKLPDRPFSDQLSCHLINYRKQLVSKQDSSHNEGHRSDLYCLGHSTQFFFVFCGLLRTLSAPLAIVQSSDVPFWFFFTMHH